MLTYGTDFKVENLPATDEPPNLPSVSIPMFPITVVNRKTFNGPSEYIGRAMKNLSASALGNPFKLKPYGPYDRDESVLKMYRHWLWEQIQDSTSPVYHELIRLAGIALTKPLAISCWCTPELCHGDVVKKAIAFLINSEKVKRN
jgi:hypothetical protein